MSYILIIGDEEDPHVSSVCKILKKKNANYLILNPYKGSENSLTYTFNPLEIQMNSNGKSIKSSEITSVWWRLKPNIISTAENKDDFERQKFILREWQLTLEPLKHFLKDCFWINRREADSLVRNKPYQLEMAHQNGFNIPKGIISNNSTFVQEKVAKFDQFIYKPLSYFIVPPDRVLYSSFMTEKELNQKSKNIEQAPCIFQEYLDKDFELRITLVGDQVFPVKINSQKNSKTKFDWRKDQTHVEYELFVLPAEIEAKLLILHKEFKIFYGAYDFIVDPDGQYHFLEVNPAGQWLWMEEILGLNISATIADSLFLGNSQNP